MERIPDDQKTHDGFSRETLDFISVETQSYLGIVGVPYAKDVRHCSTGEKMMRFSSAHYAGEKLDHFLFESRTPPSQPTPIPSVQRQQQLAKARIIAQTSPSSQISSPDSDILYYEPCGVRYLDRLWPERGKENSEMSIPSRSTDLNAGPSYQINASHRYMTVVNQPIQELLLPRVIATFPDDYIRKYRKTFLVAALNQEEAKAPGFHTGHAIVHKLPVHVHMDEGDSGFCITFCTGEFTGGYLVFPDLLLVFRYRPGDIIIFRSRALYHGVTTWLPNGDINKHGISPGRTAHVLYTKKSTNDFTKGRPPLWASMTAVGLASMAGPSYDKDEEEFPVLGQKIFGGLYKRGMQCQKDRRSTVQIDLPVHMVRQL